MRRRAFERIPLNTFQDSLDIIQGKKSLVDFDDDEKYIMLENFGIKMCIPAMAISACKCDDSSDRKSILNTVSKKYQQHFINCINANWAYYAKHRERSNLKRMEGN